MERWRMGEGRGEVELGRGRGRGGGRRAVQRSAGWEKNKDALRNVSISEFKSSFSSLMETSGRPCQGWPSSQSVKVSMELPGDLFLQVFPYVIQTQLIAHLAPFLMA